MPLLRVDLIEGRSDEELKALLDGLHRAVVTAFNVPEGDRYQIVHEHAPTRMLIEDTGLGIERTNNVVFLQVTSRPRGREAKQEFYKLVVEELQARCQIAASDVVISMVENSDEDWSFGHGRAQFLTGEL